jgi:hypothetical protein
MKNREFRCRPESKNKRERCVHSSSSSSPSEEEEEAKDVFVY